MRVVIGSDQAGFELKEEVETFLTAEHHEVVDRADQEPRRSCLSRT